MMENLAIERAAEALYDSNLPYHNFGHALEVSRIVGKIVKRCADEGIRIDAQVVYFASLFHDAGYHEDHLARGFASKEAHSAQLAGECLRREGIDEDVIARVRDAILSTHCDAHCGSNEAKAVRAADLAGLAAPYEDFKQTAIKLKDEHQKLAGTELSWDEWTAMAGARLELFLREDMCLSNDDYDGSGQSIFHRKARENIRRLLSDPSVTI